MSELWNILIIVGFIVLNSLILFVFIVCLRSCMPFKFQLPVLNKLELSRIEYTVVRRPSNFDLSVGFKTKLYIILMCLCTLVSE